MKITKKQIKEAVAYAKRAGCPECAEEYLYNDLCDLSEEEFTDSVVVRDAVREAVNQAYQALRMF